MPTRRRVLQYGLTAGASALLPSGQARPGSLPALLCDLAGARPVLAATAAAVEPHTAPLQVPETAQPVRQAPDGDHYELVHRVADVPVLPGPATRMLTYDGRWPGPTIRAEVGRTVLVTFRNALDRPVVVHLHGANTGPDSDGHPSDEIPPGGARLYRYPNRQPAAALWYHDHGMHRTGEHVYRGLAGFYLLHDPAEDRLGLPTGVRDLPLLIADRRFDAGNQLLYDTNAHGGALGDVVCVNGVPHPYHEVAPTTYRLRILNGSNSRVYDLRLDDPDARMVQVGSDGGLLTGPVPRSAIRLSPAERADVVVDLSACAGRAVHLLDAAAFEGAPTLLRFVVSTAGPAAERVPDRLATIPALGAAAVLREVTLDRDSAGRWTLNGRPYDPRRIDFRPRLGAVERWRFTNTTPTAHPVHLHLVQFQLQSRNGTAVGAEERGWKDTALVPGRGSIEVLAQFTQHTGTFVYHCHNLEHEDHDMMAQLRVVEQRRLAGAGRLETAAAISAATFAAGSAVAFVATGAGFADALTGGPAAALLGAPVLLTAGPALAPATRGELERLRPGRIVVLGGERAVPASVLAELQALTAGRVDRVAGADRFATAAAVSRETFEPGTATAYLATGADFPDALAGGAAAAAEGAPVLLVTRTEIPEPTAAELRRLRPEQVRVLGGPGAVDDVVLAAVRSATGARVERLAGPDRFATAVAISRGIWPDGAEAVVVATGSSFPDALAGVPAAGAAAAPLLLVTAAAIPPVVDEELRRLDPSRIIVLGGPTAVGPAVAARLDALLDGSGGGATTA